MVLGFRVGPAGAFASISFREMRARAFVSFLDSYIVS